MDDKKASSAPNRFLTWTSGAYSFAVHVDRCRELTRGLHITNVPLADKHIAGIANVRGEIVTIVDLNVLLGMESPAKGRAIVRIRSGDGNTICIVADKIHEILTVQETDLHEVPSNLSNLKLEYLSGAFRTGGKLYLIVNASRIRTTRQNAVA